MKIRNLANLLYIPQATWNALRMDKDERARRMMAAFVARDIYDSGTLLLEMAQRIGGVFEKKTRAYIQADKILDVDQVWELEEANGLRSALELRITEAQQCLEGEKDV